MINDTGSFAGLLFEAVLTAAGGDIVFLGILLILIVGMALIYSRARAGTSVAVGVALVFMLSAFTGNFSFLVWIAIIGAVFTLYMAFRKRTTGG